MGENEITDLDWIDDDDSPYDDSFGGEDAIVDNDDWDDQSGNTADDNDDDGFQGDDLNDDSDSNDGNDTPPASDFLTELLKSKGINDSSKIKFENESGEIEERNWSDLSVEEQLNIVQNQEDQDTGLDDSETELINRIRLSGMSIEDYLAYERQKGISQYAAQLQSQTEPNYTVDDLSDDELFMLDLQTKIEDITDEELLQALESAKANTELYEKQVNGLRNEYKALEDNQIASERAIQEQALQQQMYEFSTSIVNSINNFKNVGDLDVNMEQEDAQQLYQFITGRDPNGINYFAKALNDPDTLTRVAWFALHGEDVFNSIQDYYRNVIAQVSKSQYEKGRQSVTKKESPTVVVSPKTNNKRNSRTTTIYDLD